MKENSFFPFPTSFFSHTLSTNIKRRGVILFSALSLLCSLPLSAEELNKDSLSIQEAFDACIAMRDAVAAQDTAAIHESADALRKCQTTDFYSLRRKDGSAASLDGHLVFDEAFADSLAEGKDVMGKADELNRGPSVRGQSADGKILTKTFLVKAKKSAKYTFTSKGHQELAVVAEAGGLVTMKVHVTNRDGFDQRFDDTKSVKTGMPQRKKSFELPTERRNTVELEILNCADKDCSVVVISN